MHLKRELGLRDLTLFAIACIVGTRWIASAAHAGPGSILLWFLAAVFFVVPLAIAVAALTVRHPKAGGLYVWTRGDFGPWHGFLAFWVYWIGIACLVPQRRPVLHEHRRRLARPRVRPSRRQPPLARHRIAGRHLDRPRHEPRSA